MSTPALRAVLARIETYKARAPHRSRGIEAALNRAIATALADPDTAGALRYCDDMFVAISLVPPGHGWTLCHDGYAGCERHDPDESIELRGPYQTPALALIAAIIRARIEMAEPTPSRWETWETIRQSEVMA